MERHNVSSSAEWESAVGYSRAVRIGPHVHVAGTVATDANGTLVKTDDPYKQTVQAIKNIRQVLHDAGAALNDVIRTRMYVSDIDQWRQIGKAHGEFFGKIRPVTTMVEVGRLIETEAKVEIEADAYVLRNERTNTKR